MDFLWWFAQIVNVWWFAQKIYVLSTVPKLMVAVRLLEKHRVLKMDSRPPPLLSGQTTVQHSSLDKPPHSLGKPPHSSLHQRGLSCPTLCRNRREVELRARLCGCWAESQHKLLLWSVVKPVPQFPFHLLRNITMDNSPRSRVVTFHCFWTSFNHQNSKLCFLLFTF